MFPSRPGSFSSVIRPRKFHAISPMLLAAVFAVLALLGSRAAYATTYTVTSNIDSGSGSLRAAITAATSGSDTINFSNVIGTIYLTSTLTINNSVTINGPGANLLTVSGHSTSVITVNSGTVSISGLTIAGGYGSGSAGGGEGGGIYSQGTLTVTNCVFSGNGAAYFGGGIYNQGTLVVSGSTFSSNGSNYGGGITNRATATIENSTFSGNAASEQGGGIYNTGGLSVSSSTFSGNSSISGGGAISDFGGGAVALANSILAGNSAGDCNNCGTQSANNLIGGDAHLGPLQYNGGSTLTMMPLSGSPAIGAGTGSKLTPDQRGFACATCGASDLGAVQTNYLPVTTLTDSGAGSLRDAITLASAAGSADIIFQSGLTGTITLASALPNITGNLNIEGPGANVITVSGANAYPVFTIPTAGIFVNLNGLTVANALGANPSDGGGINNSGAQLTVSNSAFTGNNMPTGFFGGGIASYGSAPSTMVTNSTFSGNQAQSGGGIFSNGMLVVTNSTFFGNVVPGGNIGGGILSQGLLLVTDSTFSGNSAGQGGGIMNNGGSTALVANSILAGNTGGDCYSCTQTGPIFTGGNPQLSPLQLNGGTVPTMLPLPGSPAIQIGDATQLPAGLTTDQRGFPRTTAGKLDVGAAQTNYTSVQFVQQPTDTLINADIAPAVTLEVLETNTNLTAPNNTDAVSGIPITLTFSGIGTLGGTLTQTTTGGAASFGDLKVDTAGTGDTLATSLTVTPTGITPAQTLTATSVPFDITLTPSTVNFNPLLPASVSYGVAPLTLKANVYSSGTPTGQTVTFQVDSGPATVSGNVLTIHGAGTVVVEGDAAANSSYGASDATASIAVQQVPLTVTANNATRAYGAANPVFAGTVNGVVSGDSFTETFATSATAASNPGSYSIVPTAAGLRLADYTVTNVNGTLTVTAAATTTTLASSASSITAAQSVTFTATVASSAVTPTGMVTFYNGTTSIGTGTVNSSGVATLTIATLAAAGDPAFAASYGATLDYAASTSPTIFVTVAATTQPSFTLMAATASLSIPQGQTGKTALQLLPAGGYSGTVTFRCSNLPANAVCTFVQNSVQLTGNNQPVNVGLTIYTSLQQARFESIPKPTQSPVSPILPALAFWWPGSLAGLAGFRQKRKLSKSRWLHLCLLLLASGALAVGLAGCGGMGFGPYVTPAGTSTVTVTATATSGTVVPPQTVNLTLTIAQ
jgi:hypothetical protein